MSNIKELIRQEIERLKEENHNIRCQHNEKFCIGYDEAFNDLLTFIDSLPEEKPSEDLEEAAEKYSDKYCSDWAYRLEYEDAFIAGAEWAIHYQEKKIADAYEKGKQEGIRVVRSWESSHGQCGY